MRGELALREATSEDVERFKDLIERGLLKIYLGPPIDLGRLLLHKRYYVTRVHDERKLRYLLNRAAKVVDIIDGLPLRDLKVLSRIKERINKLCSLLNGLSEKKCWHGGA